jgi:uncharacterized protein YidB (DUF937 family)
MDILGGIGGLERGGRRGMSPIAMAIMGLLAYKAVKGMRDRSSTPAGPPGAPAASEGGILGDLLKGGGLGGLLSGGLNDLLKQFQSAGKGEAAESWIAPGQNIPITPTDLTKVLTPEQIDFLTERTGLSREELLAGLSEQLPKTVDQLTPHGRVPPADEMERLV